MADATLLSLLLLTCRRGFLQPNTAVRVCAWGAHICFRLKNVFGRMKLFFLFCTIIIVFLLLLFLPCCSCIVGVVACTSGNYYYYTMMDGNNSIMICKPCTNGTFCSNPNGCLNSCTPCPAHTNPDSTSSTCLSGTCVVCTAGAYCVVGSSLPCPLGTFSSMSGLSACSACSPGSYASSTGSSFCAPCTAGYFSSSLSSSACSACAVGTARGGGGGNSSCPACPNGTYASAQAMSACLQCSPGTYTSSLGMTAPCFLLCPPGTVLCNSSICPRGTYATAQGAVSSAACLQCLAGTYQTLSGAGATACANCSINTYLSREDAAAGLKSCTACQPNMGTLQAASTSAADCLCVPGFYYYYNSCIACTPGSYSPVMNSLTACLLCPSNTYDASSSSSAASRIDMYQTCTYVNPNCFAPPGSTTFYANAGYYRALVTQTCSPCPKNTFFAIGGLQTACLSCTNGVAAQSTLCLCNAGYYFDDSLQKCATCPPSSYYCLGGTQPPTPCPLNTFTLNHSTSNINVSSCVCVPGYYSYSSKCQPCPVGAYCTGEGASSSPCPLNSISPPGTSSINGCVCVSGYYMSLSSCIPCPNTSICASGVIALTCPSFSLPANTSTTCVCISGYYNNNTNGSALVVCLPCPANYYCNGNQRQPCPPNSTTLQQTSATSVDFCKCLQGLFMMNVSQEKSSSICLPCPANYYCPVAQGSAIQCPPFSISPPFSFSQAACICDAGYEKKAYACEPCTAGTYYYSDIPGVCFGCAAGTFSDRASTTCYPCPQGSYAASNFTAVCSPCAFGTYTSGLQSSSCAACSPGTYTAQMTSTACLVCSLGSFASALASSSCSACSPGKYSSAAAAAGLDCTPLNCTQGTYSSATGLTTPAMACLSCPAGTYSSAPDRATACVDCAPGTYSSQQGASVCWGCAPGSFSSSSSSSQACQQCLPGFFASTTTSCLACAAGFYAPLSGSSLCTACPASSYSTMTAATSMDACRLCPTGAYGCLGCTTCFQCVPGTLLVFASSLPS